MLDIAENIALHNEIAARTLKYLGRNLRKSIELDVDGESNSNGSLNSTSGLCR
jgi:hypothetical protein